MTAPEKLYTPQGEIEARCGLIPLEELLSERDELVSQVARLRAVHGPFGTYDALRKIELAKVAAMIRAQSVLEGKRVTESYLEESSHCHDAYVAWVTTMTTEKADYIILENRIAGINDTIMRGNVVGRFVSQEIGLTR